MTFGRHERLVLYGILAVLLMLIPVFSSPLSVRPSQVSQSELSAMPRMPERLEWHSVWYYVSEWLAYLRIEGSKWASLSKSYAGSWTRSSFVQSPIAEVYATITRVQSKSASNNTIANSIVVTLNSSPTNGNALILGFAVGNTSISISSISQTGATWNSVVTVHTNATSEIWAALNVSGASASITVNLSTFIAAKSVVIAEYTGLATSGAVDKTTSNNGLRVDGNPQSVDSGTTSTTTGTNEVWFASLTCYASGNIDSSFAGSPTNGFSNVAKTSVTGGSLSQSGNDKIVSATGTANTADTCTPQSSAQLYWAGAIATFGPASASLSDAEHFSDSVGRLQSVGKPLTDQLGFTDSLTRLRNVPKSFSEVLNVSDTLTRLRSISIFLSGTVAFSEDVIMVWFSAGVAHNYRNLGDALNLIDSLSRFGPPAVPGSFTAVKDTSNPVGTIDLSWTSDPSANPAVTSYTLQRSPDQSTWTTTCTCTTTSFADTGLSPATGYYYRIRAFNGQYSAYSGIASAVTDSYLSGGGSPTTSYTLVVLIKDLLGTPLQGVSVSQGSTSLLTDASGIASFGSLTGGSYTLEVSASGCTTTSQPISLNSDHTTSSPFIINVACGTQTATTTGTAPNLPAIESFLLPILGIALLAIAVTAFFQTRKQKRKREAR